VISIGDKLNDTYRVKRRLGGGGFGEVFLADDEKIPSRKVAIKVLARPGDTDQSDLLWEMRTLAQFNNRHVVAFYHHFTDGDRLYLVMEFCPGGSLADRLAKSGHCSVDQVFAWGVQLCDTLALVHGEGIVHHDIKPHNILFGADGTIKLGDFGIANRNGGTLLYMPPEMLLGDPVERTDARVDVYALGLTLLESVTGRHPFEELRRAEALQARIAHQFVPADLPGWVQEVLLRATHPTPELRFQTAQDFAEAVRHRHVPYLVDGRRIKADSLAREAELALGRRKWRRARRLSEYALRVSPDSIAALLAAGRCALALRRVEEANRYFARAVAVSPRTHVQRELGWIALERGRLPTAISLLTDHLRRNASDYEAYNLLLRCFYLSGRFDVARSLAEALLEQKPPTDCFSTNLLLCRLLAADCLPEEIESLRDAESPFVRHNARVATEQPSAWTPGGDPLLKSKLLFEEFRFAEARRTGKANTLVIHTAEGIRRDCDRPIVSIGSLQSNDIVIRHRSVSRRHCVIVNYPDDVWLYDLESTIGTFVDSQRVEDRIFLDGPHELKVGEVEMRVATNSSRLI
jgi:tetratricopeptide (TPR) repeat protein